MKLKNTAGRVLKVPSLGIEVEPDGIVEVEDGYCKALRAVNGSRVPPIIESLAPGLRPVSEEDLKIYDEPSVWEPPDEVPSIATLMNQGASPGVAEILAAKAADEAEEKKAPPKKKAAKKSKAKSKATE